MSINIDSAVACSKLLLKRGIGIKKERIVLFVSDPDLY